jgi:hypothetical protein
MSVVFARERGGGCGCGVWRTIAAYEHRVWLTVAAFAGVGGLTDDRRYFRRGV